MIQESPASGPSRAKQEFVMTLLLLLALIIPIRSFGQTQATQDDEPSPDRRQPSAAGRTAMSALMRDMQRMGPWDEQYEMMIGAVRKVFDRNGWKSEADQFALDLMSQVEAIPPMQFKERFDKLTELFRDRYKLDDDQQQALRSIVIRDMVGMFSKHSDRIVQYVGEIVRTRADGEAITPGQVARWVELAHPVMDDMREQMTNSAEEFRQQLRPEQQETLKRDLDAATHRLDRFEELSRDWEAGKWAAEDWGIENDRIQVSGKPGRTWKKPGQGEPAAAEHKPDDRDADDADGDDGPDADDSRPDGKPATPPADRSAAPGSEKRGDEKVGKGAPAAEDEWAQYVRTFIARYALDEPQQNRAWAFYRDARQRGDQIHAKLDGKPPASARPNEAKSADEKPAPSSKDDRKARPGEKSAQKTELQTRLDEVFQQLRTRLDRLPTRAQRRAAEGDTDAKSRSTD